MACKIYHDEWHKHMVNHAVYNGYAMVVNGTMMVSNGGHPRILVYDGYIMMVNTWCKIVTNKMKDG